MVFLVLGPIFKKVTLKGPSISPSKYLFAKYHTICHVYHFFGVLWRLFTLHKNSDSLFYGLPSQRSIGQNATFTQPFHHLIDGMTAMRMRDIIARTP